MPGSMLKLPDGDVLEPPGPGQAEYLLPLSACQEENMPMWIALYLERGKRIRCFFGHRMYPTVSLGSKWTCWICWARLPRGSAMLHCYKCSASRCRKCCRK